MREISYGFYISELKFAQRLTGQPYNVVIGWSVEIFFLSDRTKEPKVRYDFRSSISKFRCKPTFKVFILKKFQGAHILIFFVKFGMKLPFTLKNKHRNTNLKFDFL